jgi:phage terminase large subunit GpA-like protein
MGSDVSGEGDPVSLAEARTATFPDGKVVVCSTPTLEGGSPIWALFEEGTQFKWSWPCPECSEYFAPRLELLKWPEGCTPHRALKEARLVCPECGSELEDHHRPEMNRRGVFLGPGERVTSNNEIEGAPIESDTASFWVSGLCSPWRSWGQRAKAFIEATRSKTPGRVQACVNTAFGELYRLEGEAPDWTRVAELRGAYESGTVPEGCRVLTCGVDVQGGRLVYALRGWGLNSESWLIEADELWGETAHSEVWERLGDLLQRSYDGHVIKRMFIDSGFNPSSGRGADNMIYNFCRRYKGRAFPTKGHDRQDRPLKASKIDVSLRGRTIPNGLVLWHVDSDYFKSWVHTRIEWPAGESGAWHLPSDASDGYCQQVVAESRLVTAAGRVKWIKIREDNHFLDAESLNVAAAHSVAVHTLRREAPETAQADRKPKRRRHPPLPRSFGMPYVR